MAQGRQVQSGGPAAKAVAPKNENLERFDWRLTVRYHLNDLLLVGHGVAIVGAQKLLNLGLLWPQAVSFNPVEKRISRELFLGRYGYQRYRRRPTTAPAVNQHRLRQSCQRREGCV
jgi:hypothetical protein